MKHILERVWHMLQMNSVSTTYGRIPMLRDVDISIAPRQAVCILGANGAGKTTILKTILGLVKATKGSITFKGQRIDTLATHQIVQQGIAMVPESEGLFPRMTVEDNLRFGAYFEKRNDEIAKRLEDVLSIFPRLRERIRQNAGTLSGGERTMLAIARGLVAKPQLLLLDEPSLGLAPVLVEEVYKWIEHISREQQVAILLVEQNARKALSIASYGYVVEKGQIILKGDREKLMQSDVVQRSYLYVEGANSAKG